MRTALIFSGSSTWTRRETPAPETPAPETPAPEAPAPGAAPPWPADVVIAADSGWYEARRLGIVPDELHGDLDSVLDVDVDEAARLGVEIHRHPTDKDATDLELALDRAVVLGAERLLVVGPGGGRLDHQVGELLLLASEKYAEVVVEARLGGSTVHPVRGGPRQISGRAGASLSIVPIAGPATVSTTGLRWPLVAEQLDPGSTRGISNEFDGDIATVGTDRGVVLVVVPFDDRLGTQQ